MLGRIEDSPQNTPDQKRIPGFRVDGSGRAGNSQKSQAQEGSAYADDSVDLVAAGPRPCGMGKDRKAHV